jgi:hypothetical protein
LQALLSELAPIRPQAFLVLYFNNTEPGYPSEATPGSGSNFSKFYLSLTSLYATDNPEGPAPGMGKRTQHSDRK